MSSMEFRSYKNVAEHFNCPIHLGKLRDPRRLSCEHTFCAECLNGCINTALAARNDGMFECPVCRAKHHIPPSETDDFARGFPVDAFCVIQLHTLTQYEKSTLCDKHIEKFKEYFCFTHRELLCSDCVVEGHARAPCSIASIEDSITEVRLQIKELVGKLRLQEERARRIMESQVATSYSEELLKNITDVEKTLNKFNRTMKSKLKEAKQKVAEATKISQSDKDHLSTVHSMISKTKVHVEGLISKKNAKKKDTVGEILNMWTPLEQETVNFDNVLDDIETRPFCVNVRVDEDFLEFISYDKSPLIVSNESVDRLPLTPTKDVDTTPEKPPVAPRKTQLHTRSAARSSKHGKRPENPDFLMPEELPSPIPIRRTISLSPQLKQLTQTKLYVNHRPMTYDNSMTVSSLPSSARQSPSRSKIKSSSAFPKVGSGELIKRGTGKSVHDENMKLKKMVEMSNFELPCGDIVLLDNHIITVTEHSVQKFSIDYQFRESLPLRCPWRLCKLRDTTNVAINHNTRFISIVATSPSLVVLYRIETEKPYSEMCHMSTTLVEDRFGRVKYSEHLALTFTTDLRVDSIDILTISYDNSDPHSNFQSSQVTRLLPQRVKSLLSSDINPVVRSPNTLAATTDGKRLIIGTEAAVVCMNRKGNIIWTRPVLKFVSSVCCEKGLIFVCIENERKLMILDEAGNMLYENIFPLGCNITRPNRVSVEHSQIVVREFSETDWKSCVHVFWLAFG